MSTHGAGRPPGSTYYAASYREEDEAWPGYAPPSPRPGYGSRPGPGYGPSPVPILPPSGGPEDDSFPPMDPSGFGPGAPPGSGYAVPGARPGSHGRQGAAGLPAAPARRGLPIVLGVLAVVLVLCIGGGSAAYFFFVAEETPADGADPVAVASSPRVSSPAAAVPSNTPSPSKPAAGGEEEVSGDLSGYKQGDCLTVDEANDNRVEKAKCTDPGAQKVLLRKNGTLDDAVCQTTAATFSLSQDATGSSKDFVLCVGPAD